MYGTASKHNHELVSALGATPIDYRTEDFVERVRSLTGDGVDVVIDSPVLGGWITTPGWLNTPATSKTRGLPRCPGAEFVAIGQLIALLEAADDVGLHALESLRELIFAVSCPGELVNGCELFFQP